MILVVGLGNPGPEYKGTRHNMGYMVLDKIADSLSFSFDRTGFKGEYTVYKNDSLLDDVVFLKPTTFMNLSGASVQEAAAFYKIPSEDILVIVDDMALDPGKIRLRKDGSAGGHNGLKDIIEKLGTDKFKRIRVGIGEPKFDSISYVLGKPSKEEEPLIDEALEQAAKATKDYLLRGFDHAMNAFNKH